jgi:hypothetical protein
LQGVELGNKRQCREITMKIAVEQKKRKGGTGGKQRKKELTKEKNKELEKRGKGDVC